jgi:tripartite-type tricarboxylate transporter receptor subunit TctC
VVNSEVVRDRLRTMGNSAKAGTPEEFTQTVAQYVERWSGVINSLGLVR